MLFVLPFPSTNTRLEGMYIRVRHTKVKAERRTTQKKKKKKSESSERCVGQNDNIE